MEIIDKTKIIETIERMLNFSIQKRDNLSPRYDPKPWHTWDGGRQMAEVILEEIKAGKFDAAAIVNINQNAKQGDTRKIIILGDDER